jgi:hypothetical protein
MQLSCLALRLQREINHHDARERTVNTGQHASQMIL